MKASFIATIFNEETSIDSFLASIEKQAVSPEEIVLVDAGSKDRTVKKIKRWQKKLPIKVIIRPGANRSQGRNIALKRAKNKIVAISDAGCLLDPNWLKEITAPLKKKNIFVVAGNYQPVAETSFQKCLSLYTCADIYRKNKSQFLPSSRSLALKKVVWEKTGGYPEELDYCEDLVFDQKIKQSGFCFFFSPQAIVYWPQRKTAKEAFKQFYNYALGDGQVFFSPYQSHSVKISFIFLRYLISALVLFLVIKQPGLWLIPVFLLLTYLFFWPIIKFRKKLLFKKVLFFAPSIQILSDLAIMTGVLRGVFEKNKKRYNN
ncbi:MAG: glycosyltransferase [Candidatus Shapirobacteria bacterium]|nr:glycosyltransferase [Candidatus Shapirobacteria bacterium]